MRLIAALGFITFTACLSAEPPPQDTPAGGSGKAIPFDQLGVEAQKQYSGDGIAIMPTAAGAQLRTVFQKLEGEATPEGLWLTSTREEDKAKAERFRVLAAELGRHQGHVDHQVRLQREGTVNATAESATFVRAGLTEEYRVSMDGVRQDFIVMDRPAGDGLLSVVLEVTGAQAAAASYGAKLTLAGSGREIAYSRLHVTDATGRELTATLEVLSVGRLAVRVDDAAATYPVRIDPTFSDANWVSLNPGIIGANNTVRATVVDGSGNLYIGGSFTLVGTVAANRIAKWNGSSWSALGAGMNDHVFSLTVIGSDLYAGGYFTMAGGVAASHIAKWNGSAWSALGTGTNDGSAYGPVHALAVIGDDLYAGGSFYTAGGGMVNGIAKWNGSSWSALGTGVNGNVYALAVIGSDLYAGGVFYTASGVTVSNIAKWDGSAWSALGSGMNGNVNALAVIGGDLYAGGEFITAGGVTVSRLAKWNGSMWSALGSGMNGNVNALMVKGTDLYAGGEFTTAGGVSANCIAKWNASEWSAIGSGMNYEVAAIAMIGTDLYAGGDFTAAGGVEVNRIAKWNGSTWSALSIGLNGNIAAIAVIGTDLYAGGGFTAAGGVTANHIAKWNGSAWSALGTGIDGPVTALAASGTDLYAGGLFNTAGGVATSRIAKWNGSTWSALGFGMNFEVYALVVSGTDLYAGGEFTIAGEVAANRIAKWDGSEWSALGTGINGSGWAYVTALMVSGGDLYAGGEFTTAGGVPANHIAKWNGSAWSALGSGMNNPVRALAVIGNDLYAGGGFTTAGGVTANRIAKWNGSEWSALHNGMNGTVYALAVSGGDLYAGGAFGQAGWEEANRIAKWDGSEWLALGSGVDGEVRALAADATGHLYLAGQFYLAGTTVSPYIAQANLLFPSVTTSAVSNLLPTGVTLNGTVNPEGFTTTAHFEYGLTTNYGSNVSVALSPNNGITAQPVNATLSGLLPNTLYHYRLSATNAGTAVTTDATFTTLTANTPQESWRQLYFGITGNTGNAADSFDFDKDGLINLVEWGLGLDPTQGDTSQLPVAQKTGSNFVMSFTQPAGVSGITYGAEWSATLLANDWHPVADTGTGGQHIFSVPVGGNTKLFMRLVITSP